MFKDIWLILVEWILFLLKKFWTGLTGYTGFVLFICQFPEETDKTQSRQNWREKIILVTLLINNCVLAIQ